MDRRIIAPDHCHRSAVVRTSAATTLVPCDSHNANAGCCTVYVCVCVCARAHMCGVNWRLVPSASYHLGVPSHPFQLTKQPGVTSH